MTDKLRELLEDVQTVYEGKGMIVHPNSFDRLRMEVFKLDNVNKQQSEQIEKLIDFVLSKTECCDVCPITDTCINSEGTCPYAGILAKGEEAVTREWLMQKIAKEIKEK